MSIFPDATSTSNVHSANIDTAMTAQCFFKLKDLGFFKELKTKTTGNSLSAEQIEDNYEDLHENNIIAIYDPYITEIKHLGLGTFRVLKDTEKYRLDIKVAAQFKKWDEQWARISRKKKSQADKEASLNIAEERTRNAQEKQIDDLLINALNIDDTVNWDSLKDTKEFKVPNPKYILERRLSIIAPPALPTFRELPKEPDFELYKPQLSLVDKIFKSLKKKKISKQKLFIMRQ